MWYVWATPLIKWWGRLCPPAVSLLTWKCGSAEVLLYKTLCFRIFQPVGLKNKCYNIKIFHIRLKLPSERQKRLKWESCLITKRKLPSFYEKSGNFLFVIRQLHFFDLSECNKNHYRDIALSHPWQWVRRLTAPFRDTCKSVWIWQLLPGEGVFWAFSPFFICCQ